MATQNAHTDLARAQELEALKRVPQTGAFNEVSIPVVSSAAFGTIGYHIGKWIGRLADDQRNAVTHGRFERGFKVFFAGAFGLLAAAVSIKQTRESKSQAVELAKRSLELEQHNAALASVVTRPVGTLIETFDKTPDTAIGTTPLVDVSEAEPAGRLAAQPLLEKN